MKKIKKKKTESGPTHPNQNTLGHRLRKIWAASGLKQKDFADQLRVSPATFIHYLNNRRIPRADFIKLLCRKRNINPEWLLFGEGPVKNYPDKKKPYKYETHSVRDTSANYGTPEQQQMVVIPRVRARFSSQTNEWEPEPGPNPYAFDPKWLADQGDPKQMLLMDVYGEQDLDTVLIDTSQTDITAGRFYAVKFNDLVVVKMIDAVPGMLIFKNKNNDPNPIVNNINNHESKIKILGRIVWWCKKQK